MGYWTMAISIIKFQPLGYNISISIFKLTTLLYGTSI